MAAGTGKRIAQGCWTAAAPGFMIRPLQKQSKGNTMGIESLIVFILIGAIAGWLAGQLVKGYGFGLIGNIVVGIVGAFIAGWLFPALGISLGSGIVAAIIHATIGAVILLVLVRLVKQA